MFPDIVREEIFRLETQRLWLRWPLTTDAAVVPADRPPPVQAQQGREALPEAASGDPYGVASSDGAGDRIGRTEALRAANAAGTALHLVLTGRGLDRRVFGAIGLTPIRERIENCGLKLAGTLDPNRCGQGLMTEAVQAMVDAAFMLTDTPLIAASARVRDPAFRRVLEKCGFSYCGNGLDTPNSGAGLVASDRFRLDRKAWASLKAWRIPGVVHARGRGAADCRPGA
ncbi:MAG TPA: GNAT family protein [Lichenihabitans sp.]|jgi:RimJ/RimL family protein N-acetyltransferase|nr:GNAT family protein [Lichenihabitans sp.]